MWKEGLNISTDQRKTLQWFYLSVKIALSLSPPPVCVVSLFKPYYCILIVVTVTASYLLPNCSTPSPCSTVQPAFNKLYAILAVLLNHDEPLNHVVEN